MSNLTKLPITFLDSQGNPADAHSPQTHPMIKVVVTADKETPNNAREVWALVDTSADGCYASAKLVREMALPLTSAQISNSATYQVESGKHLGFLSFPGFDKRVQTPLTSTEMRTDNRAYEVIIGLNVIWLGGLLLDFSNNDYALYI